HRYHRVLEELLGAFALLALGVPAQDVASSRTSLGKWIAQGVCQRRINRTAGWPQFQQCCQHLVRDSRVVGERDVPDQQPDRSRRLALRQHLQGRRREGGTGTMVDLGDAVLRTASDLAVPVGQRRLQRAQGRRAPLDQGLRRLVAAPEGAVAELADESLNLLLVSVAE